MNLANAISRLDGWQQRRRLLGVPVAVMKKFLVDGADALGVQIAYWGFFSVFAVLLVFTSVLGFVFQSDSSVQQQLLDSTLELMPVIGPQISGDIGTLTGSGVALAIGVIGGLWTGLAVTLAIGNALDRIWGVSPVQRRGFLSSRWRGLAVLATVGCVNVLATAAVGVMTTGSVGTSITGYSASSPPP